MDSELDLSFPCADRNTPAPASEAALDLLWQWSGFELGAELQDALYGGCG
jgi:hypothetical protein